MHHTVRAQRILHHERPVFLTKFAGKRSKHRFYAVRWLFDFYPLTLTLSLSERESKASLAILYMLTIRPVEIKADGIPGRARSESRQDIVPEQ